MVTIVLTFALLSLSINWSGLFVVNYLDNSFFPLGQLTRYISMLTGLGIIGALFLYSINHYLKIFKTVSFKNNIEMLLGVFTLLLALLMTRIMMYILQTPVDASHLTIRIVSALKYTPLFPSIMSAILCGILLPIPGALIIVSVFSLCIGIMYHGDFVIFIMSILSLSIGILISFRARRRSHLMRAGLVTGIIQGLFIFAGGIISEQEAPLLIIHSLNGITNGFLGGFFCAGLLPIMEALFHVTTDIRLVELSDLNHPLLKKLVLEAPGTYHHSLIVANLAESAAEVVGANPLLTRVGSYFHDIGKLKKPEYFSENEWRGKSRHDKLIPSMSSLIIISHVKDGIDLSRKYGLPKEIVEIIQQHHGRSLVFFFFKRAEQNLQMNETINEEEYRYPGPIPQTKEAAIILLADATEAASRSLDKPTPSRISNLIENIFNSRIADGQLNNSQLTMNDLTRIKECFAYILNSIFHTRPKYPDDETKIIEDTHENQDKQSPETVSDIPIND